MVSQISTESFSIERLESVMISTGTTWKELNDEIGEGTEKTLRKRNPPMFVINKVCNYIGLDSNDYVMMKSNSYKIKNQVTQKFNIARNKNVISVDLIDFNLLKLHIEESEWSNKSLSTLMSSKSILCNGLKYFKQYKSICEDDLNTLCWALNCKISDICNIPATDNDEVPKRCLNSRQVYVLNKSLIDELQQDLKMICKRAKLPYSFLSSSDNIYVSLEMIDILSDAIVKVTGKQISNEELCVNFKAQINKQKQISNPNKRKKYTDKEITNAINLLKNNSYQEVSKITGISASTLFKWNAKNKKEENKMEIPNDVREAVKDNAKEETNTNIKEGEKEMDTNKEITTNVPTEETTDSRNKHYSRFYNKNDKPKSSYLRNVFDRIDCMSDEEFDKLLIYIESAKQHRTTKNNLLE